MKLFTAEDLEIEPIVMMAENEHEVISHFHWSIIHGFGFWPNLNFTVAARPVGSLPRSDDLWTLLAEGRRGYASLSEKGWERVPFKN